MRVLIAGGGIAGLTAALACHAQGLDPLVLEQAPELGEVGAGLQLSPNAMRVLVALGLEQALLDRAVEPEALELRAGSSGHRVFSIPIRSLARQRHGAPYLHIHRRDLVDVLASALAQRCPSALRLGARVEQIGTGPTGQVSVGLPDGQMVAGDVLVGADGLHSLVRRHLFGAAQAQFTGQVAWRATIPAQDLPDVLSRPNAIVWTGAGRHVVTYLLRRRALLNIVAVVEERGWIGEGWSEPGDPAALARAFGAFPQPVRHALGLVTSCFRWALHVRPALSRWSTGQIGLMGDACHPTLPFQAQGAAMAIEDAWVLARALKVLGPVTGLERYASLRQPRTRALVAAAAANAGTFHRGSLAGQLGTYGPMWLANRLAPSIIHTRQDWIYGHDVLAQAESIA
jgi:salicylate hydroxylase